MDEEIKQTTIFVGAYILVATIIALFLCFISFVIYKASTRSGRIDYCYIESYSNSDNFPVFKLKGFVDWGSDKNMGTFQTFDAAVKAAKDTECLLKTK